MMWPGPRAVWRDLGPHALAAGPLPVGRGCFICDRSMGACGVPSAGGPKERGAASACSMATKYKLSCQETNHNKDDKS